MNEDIKPAPRVVRELFEEGIDAAGKSADEIILEVLHETEPQEKTK